MILLLGFIIVTLVSVLGAAIFRINKLEYENLALDENTLAITSGDFSAPDTPFLKDEEMVVVQATSSSGEEIVLPIMKVLFEYIEVVEGCGIHFDGNVCLNVRSGPGLEFPVVSRLRNGMVLKVGGQVEYGGETWYKIIFDEWLRYPERVKDDWYVSANYVQVLLNEGEKTSWEDGNASTTKKIVVNRSLQKLYAYEGDSLFMEVYISTGLEFTPTPRGTFTVFKKTPSRYMQGPLPNLPDNQYYDLPGVPWNLYFTHGGAVIHGAYWHNSFGKPYSHGCVNLSPEDARKLYDWAELGTKVIVED